ncbi:MAG: diguanylate cyclase domain-containing protein [Eubacteriales bacterium]
MKFLKFFLNSSIFRLYLILLLAVSSEAGFFIYALNTNLTPYVIVTIGVAIASVIGTIGMFLSFKPMNRILNFLVENDAETDKRLIKTGMSDFDLLISHINDLLNPSENVTAKLATILDLSGRNMALFEIHENTQNVYITQRLFPMLDETDTSLYKTGLIPKDIFTEKLAKLDKFVVPAYSTNISTMYHIETRLNTSRWLRITTLDGDNSTLGLIEDVSDEMLKKTKLEYERDHDILTSLFNRRAFIRKVTNLFSAAENLKTAAMISIDLDKLKMINDTYGHEYGDEYIRTFGNLLNSCLPKNSIIARFGGDEFLVFLYAFDSIMDIKHEIIKLTIAIRNSSMRLTDSTEIDISASGGIAYYPEHATSIDLLMKYADFAMYTVKRGTRGAFAEFNMEDFEKNMEVFDNSELIAEFMQRKLYEFTFVPILNSKNGEVLGYRKIMQSSHPQIPNENALLELAKTDEQKQKLEKFIIEESLKAFDKLPNKNEKKLFMSTVPSHALIEEDYLEISKKYSDLLKNVVVQARTSLGIAELPKIKIKRIKLFGGSLCLAGYGVEQYDDEFIYTTEPKFLKLDLSLTQSLVRDFSTSKLIESLISSAHQKNISVIAEGIPNLETAYSLVELGVDYVEGPFITNPSTKPPARFPILEARFKNKPKCKDSYKNT